LLDIRDFEIHGNDVLFYTGVKRHYGIAWKQDANYYLLYVGTMDNDGEYVDEKIYHHSKLSTAIASIEAMENGEEV